MTVYIYTLSDPDASKVMYVGQTTVLSKRLYGHVNSSKKNASRKDRWIQSLLAQGKNPLMTIVDECEESTATEIEEYWIHCFLVLGKGILNDRMNGRRGWSYAKVRRCMYDNWAKVKPDEPIRCYICKGDIVPETARLDFDAMTDESWQCEKCYEKYGTNPYLIDLWNS